MGAPGPPKGELSASWLAVVNLRAGAFRHGALGRAFLDELERWVSALAFTAGPGSAARIAADAHRYRGLVAVGGDGTVMEVVSAMDRAGQRFAVVPAGTGNCLAVDLGLPTADAALRALGRGETRPIDLIEVTLVPASGPTVTRWVASTAGLGYVAQVADLAKRRFSPLGASAYAAASAFVRPRQRQVQLAVDGGRCQLVRVTGVLVNNTRHVGLAVPFPEAELDDGVLDVYLFRTHWWRQCLHNLQMVTGIPVRGTPRPQRLATLTVRCTSPETVMLDGELFPGVTGLELVCRPSALTCVAQDGKP